MDAVQATLLFTGVGITLIPLEWIQNVFFGNNTPITTWTLLVPLIGICMIGISLLSYHKNALRVIFYGVCKTIDQTGLGMGLMTDLMSVIGGSPSTPATPTTTAATSATSSNGLIAASELPSNPSS